MTSWRIAIRHTTTSQYAGEVSASYNEARLTPMRSPYQVLIESRVDVAPGASLRQYRDYFGTTVHSFDVHVPHTELHVIGSSVVSTSSIEPITGASWTDLQDEQRCDELYEFLVSTPLTEPDEDLQVLAVEIRAASPTPLEAVQSAIAHVREHMVYERGHTNAATPGIEAWARARGVCQDFAHVTVALLRAMGVPARYVSGYLHPDEEGAIGVVVSAESHAWIDAWLGAWAPFDPTNDRAVGERHVVVAHGRDYGDVAPLRGVYTGAAVTAQDVAVEMTRLG
jgi:transglutaminase-like putative cysteine protease